MLTHPWLALVVLRIGWSVLPQTGYIHPDEFFQTVEVVAGDALEVSVERTWEFNKTFPLRSILLPKLLFHPPFKLLQILAGQGPSGSLNITGRQVMCASRLVMAIASLLLDLSLLHMCRDLGVSTLPSQRGLVILASSYVTLTYVTHTFSNSIEALLFATVVMLIIKSRHWDKKLYKECDSEESSLKNFSREEKDVSDTDSDILNDSYGMINKLHSNAFDIRRRKCKQSDETHPLMNKEDMETPVTQSVTSSNSVQQSGNCILTCVLLAILNTAGIFNRPTFVLFSGLPFMWWLCLGFQNISMLMFRVTIFIFVSIATAVIFCVTDTIYYHNLAMADIADLDSLLPKLVLTPLNFILYNTKVENLAQHGTHPFYLHVLVNMPLLFGPLMIYLLKGLSRTMKICLWFEKPEAKPEADFHSSDMLKIKQKNNSTTENKSREISHIVLLGFVITPVLLLSVFPHQEPRFLIPILPLVILYIVYSTAKFSIPFWSIFCIFNLTLSVLYGLAHQGGLIPCILKLQDLTHSKKNSSSIHVIFSNTYMPPLHPLLIEENSTIHIHDLKGSSFSNIHELIFHVKISDLSHSMLTSSRFFIVMPGSLVQEFRQEFSGRLRLKTVEKFFPHLSLEDPPVIRPGTGWGTIKNRLSLFLMELEDI